MDRQDYDFIIIGGGIVGSATAWQLQQTFPDRRILLLEKEDALARHQTGHNSGVIHAGVYYQPGSLKARFCREGNRATKDFCRTHDIPFTTCGKLLVATNDIELERMRTLWDRIGANGLEREWLDADALHQREPRISGVAGIFVPSSGIVNYTQVTQELVQQFVALGGEYRLQTKVTGLAESADDIAVHTNNGTFRAQFLISCAGLMADRIVTMLGLKPDFKICPFRGEYYLLRPELNQIVQHLIYPIPDPTMPFLGVHLTPMVNGTVTVGPNAVLAGKREGYRKRDFSLADTLEMLCYPGLRKILRRNLKAGLLELKNSLSKRAYLQRVRKYCPQLTLDDLRPYPAGVRAQAVAPDGTMIDDFLFMHSARSFHVCNAPSPAATSAIPIGAHIVEEVTQLLAQRTS